MVVEPVSTSLAVASLAIELVEGIIELYRVVSAAENMPQEYRFWRTKLLMEYGRLKAFRNAAGLIQRETDDLPGSLNSDKLTLSAILTEMKVLMEGFRKMIKKYEEVDKKTQKLLDEQAAKTGNLVAEFDALSYDEKPIKKGPFSRRFWSQTKALAISTREVVTHPKRFVWALFDAEEVAKRMGRLTELNDYLEGLLHGREAILLQAGTQRSQLDIVMIKNTVEHLEHLFMASILLQERKNGYSPSGNEMREHNDTILAALARSKQLRLAGNPDSQEDSPPSYTSTLDSASLQYTQIKDLDRTTSQDGHKVRAGCKLITQNGEEKDVWVEWRAYKTAYDEALNLHLARADQVRRAQLLVALLNVEKNFKNLEMFCLPTCLGYFDDRGEPGDLHAENPHRFGLVFERPLTNIVPESLYDLLDDNKDYQMPSVTSRISLARKIANCVLYLHAISWLHHNIRSDSIIFPNSTDVSQPLLSGFDYSRPDIDADQTTYSDDANLNETEKAQHRLMNLSRHPAYQGLGKKPPYCKSFDVYGLGIVLIEIALWQRIEDLVEYPDLPAKPKGTETEQEKNELLEEWSEVAERQEEIAAKLKDNLESPDSEIMSLVKIHFGEKYHGAVLSCIEGRKAFDISDDENEMDAFIGTKYQRAFTTLVVDVLEQIQI